MPSQDHQHLSQDPSASRPSTVSGQSGNLPGQQSLKDSEEYQAVVVNPLLGKDIETGSMTTIPNPSNAMTPITERPEPRHCWICLVDEGEDENTTEQKPEWKSPCPCNLRAHEECLLEWIADLEAPTRKGAATTQILCPQCKSEIYVARPRDFLVSLIDFVSRNVKALVLPLGLSTTFGILYSGAMVHGMNSINLVFGLEESRRIWEQGMRESHIPKYLEKIFRLTDPFLFVVPSWKILVGIPSIAPALILSRTRIADHMFSALPIIYFAMHTDGRFLRQWPPSPGLSFALLPYFRSIYYEAFKYTFSDLEKKWDQAVQRKPREGETAEQVAAAAEREGDDGNVINIEIDIEMEGDEANPNEGDQPVPPQAVNALRENLIERLQQDNIPQIQAEGGQIIPEQQGVVPGAFADDEGMAQQVAPNNANGQLPAQPPPNPGQLALVDDALGREGISINRVAQSVLGALFLPAVSGVMGDIIRNILPGRLIELPIHFNSFGVKYYGKPTGLLQERWGRSLVGGALFIVLKDALMLYSKWSKAKNHGKRRVLDYVNSPGVRKR